MSKSSSTVFMYKSAFSYDSQDENFVSGVNTEAYASSNQYKSAFGYTYQMVPSVLDKGKVEETWVSKLSRSAIIFLSYTMILALFPFSLCVCVKKVNALERLVILRLGKLQPVIGPGYCIVLPLIDSCSVVDLRPKTFTISSQKVLTTDGAIIEISAAIKYCVCHAVHYVTKLHKQEQSVQSLVEHYLTNIISEKEQMDLERNQEFLLSTIKVGLNRTMVNWGLEITDVTLYSIKTLKQAEPINSLDHVFGVLKGLTTTCDFSSFAMPLVPNTKVPMETREEILKSAMLTEVDDEPYCSILTQVSNLLEDAKKQNAFNDVVATYKFIILGEKKMILSVSINNGITCVSENDDFTSDVTVTLTMEDMQDFLNFKISPIQAYLDGRFKVEGNQNLLKYLANVF